MSKSETFQKILRYYKDQTGKRDAVSAGVVADWAVKRGLLELPKPINPRTRLADEMSKAWREELRRDPVTGRPYRANHAVTSSQKDGRNHTLWGDIDEVPRAFMQKAFTQRREQIVGDCFQLSLDVDHFNGSRPKEEPINLPLDFTEDVDERKHSPRAA